MQIPYRIVFRKSECTVEVDNYYLMFAINNLYYLPKLVAYKIVYNFLKLLFEKKIKNYFFILILMMIFIIYPFRLVVKYITGFSYITIKFSSYITKDLIELSYYDYDSYSILIENCLFNINSHFYYEIIEYVKNLKIILFENTNICFNPS